MMWKNQQHYLMDEVSMLKKILVTISMTEKNKMNVGCRLDRCASDWFSTSQATYYMVVDQNPASAKVGQLRCSPNEYTTLFSQSVMTHGHEYIHYSSSRSCKRSQLPQLINQFIVLFLQSCCNVTVIYVQIQTMSVKQMEYVSLLLKSRMACYRTHTGKTEALYFRITFTLMKTKIYRPNETKMKLFLLLYI